MARPHRSGWSPGSQPIPRPIPTGLVSPLFSDNLSNLLTNNDALDNANSLTNNNDYDDSIFDLFSITEVQQGVGDSPEESEALGAATEASDTRISSPPLTTSGNSQPTKKLPTTSSNAFAFNLDPLALLEKRNGFEMSEPTESPVNSPHIRALSRSNTASKSQAFNGLRRKSNQSHGRGTLVSGQF